MILYLIRKSYRNLLNGVALILRNEAGLFHLGNHKIPSGERFIRIQGRVVSGRLVDHSHKCSCLLYRQVYRCLAEECLCSCLDSICIASEEHLIHVHVHDLVLGIASLKLYGSHPFLELDPHHLQLGHARNPAAHVLTGVKRLRKLLGDGAAASLARITAQKGLEYHSTETLEVNAGVVVETHILRSYCRVHQIWRKLFIAHI